MNVSKLTRVNYLRLYTDADHNVISLQVFCHTTKYKKLYLIGKKFLKACSLRKNQWEFHIICDIHETDTLCSAG